MKASFAIIAALMAATSIASPVDIEKRQDSYQVVHTHVVYKTVTSVAFSSLLYFNPSPTKKKIPY